MPDDADSCVQSVYNEMNSKGRARYLLLQAEESQLQKLVISIVLVKGLHCKMSYAGVYPWRGTDKESTDFSVVNL